MLPQVPFYTSASPSKIVPVIAAVGPPFDILIAKVSQAFVNLSP
jgi:hypothetical protein